jgi:DNA (cytosine-5)-methyltransferase 1
MPEIRYGSVCSGIEAATVAWEPLGGFTPAWFAEIEAFPSAVLAARWPDVPNLGDFTKIGPEHGPIGLLVGGTPCQAFSVAGERAGLDDPRGQLTFEFLSLAGRLRPRWIVWENVPGVLSIDGGDVFAAFLQGLAQLGYGFAYRVLDAQFFGVPQRRRRVFVVGYLGDWRPAAAVLFERDSLSGHPAPRREAGEGVAPCLRSGSESPRSHGKLNGTDTMPMVAGTLPASGAGTARTGNARNEADMMIPVAFSSKDHGGDAGDIAPTLRACPHAKSHANAGAPPAVAFEPRFARNDRGGPSDTVNALKAQAGMTGKGDAAPCVAFQESFDGVQVHDVAPPMSCGGGKPGQSYPAMQQGMAVRRLTPVECERLQGFPDDYTRIPWRGKPAEECPDGPRYKALGNSMAVPVMRWIGRRLLMVEEILSESQSTARSLPKGAGDA